MVQSKPIPKDRRAMPAIERQKFERRRSERMMVDAHATLFCLGNSFGEIYEMQTVDYSDSGVGLATRQPVEAGLTVSVGFSYPSCRAGYGTIVRCQPDGDGYRVGVRFERV